MPQISVIIPVFNGALFIKEALDSIQKQTVVVQEVIVVDDGSTDHTAQIVQAHPVVTKYYYQSNRGPQYARTKGVELSSGDMITFLDADDIWSEDKLSIQVDLINRYDIVIGFSQILGTEKSPFLFLNLGAALFRRKTFDQLGGLDLTLFSTDDLDLLFRAREQGIKMLVHEQVVLFHRRHSQNLTRTQLERNRKDLLLGLRQSLQRRRAAGKLQQKQFSEFRGENE